MADHQDSHLLLSVEGARAYLIQDGQESSLTPSGSQTLSLLMVPTDSPFAISTTLPQNTIQEQDFYLHLNLPPELDLPLPATTQVYPKPPSSYLIPQQDAQSGLGSYIRVELPPTGHGAGKVSQEDVDTFETILAQCTAFLERASAPAAGQPFTPYNPADYAPGGKYATTQNHGQIVLVDEDDGSVVGELAEGAEITEDPSLKNGLKNPVEIEIGEDGKHVTVRPASDDYLTLSRMPQYQKSSLVQNAASASRLIVTGSNYLGNKMSSGAESFVKKTKPNAKPMEFTPATHERVRKINAFTQGAAGLSSRTAAKISQVAQNLGAGVTRRGERKEQPKASGKPGLMNKSMIAFTTIADGVAESGRNLLTQSQAATSTVVSHKYGEEAGSIASNLAGGVKNVGLVYIDVTGVTRRAVIKSVAKGMVVGKMKDGKKVVVGGGDGGDLPEQDTKTTDASGESSQQTSGVTSDVPPPYAAGDQGHKGSKAQSDVKGQH